MVADMELDMVVDMEVDNVADKVADMVEDMVADININIDINMEIKFGEKVGPGGWLFGPKLFRPEAYPTCVSSKLCKFICDQLIKNILYLYL